MEKNPNNNIQSTDWEHIDAKLEMAADSSAEQKESKKSFGKNALRTFGAIALTATLALGMAGCGNKEAESVDTPSDTVVTEEAPIVEGDDEVVGGIGEDVEEPEVVGEDSTDTLTMDELLEGIESSTVNDVFNNHKALDLVSNWMEQNGYYDISAEFAGDVPVYEASFRLQDGESEAYIHAEISPSYGGKFMIHADSSDGERLAVWRSTEFPSSLKLNEVIDQKKFYW